MRTSSVPCIPWHLPTAAAVTFAVLPFAASAQSTLASISGTVHDPTGALVPKATVRLHRVDTNTDSTFLTDAAGVYTALNISPGVYDITVQAPGFASVTATGVAVLARQQLRYDLTETPGPATDSVTVNANDAGVIDTENAQISAALTPQAVLDLPANYRGAGSTSPVSVIQTLPGVQPDSGAYPPAATSSPSPQIKFSIQGGLPSQSETTVDGISAQNQSTNNLQGDAFPSAESIAEIRVDGVNNNAEYGQPGEITTITKAGANKPHGSVFEYLQNSALNATPFGAIKQHVRANEFGGSFGGPIVIPRVYDGHDKLFLFGTYEALRFPQTQTLQALVPTTLMKQGNFSQENATLANPFTGGTYAGSVVPINPSSAPFLQFYPDPNFGSAGESLATAQAVRGYNYLSERRADINSNQFDVRADRTLGQRGSVFARYTFKNIDQTQAADLVLPNYDAIGQYRIFATSFSYAITPRLLNEVRFGFTLEQDGNTNSFDGAGFTASTKINGLVTPAFFNGIPHLGFDGGTIYSIGERLGGTQHSSVYQYVDNLTLQAGTHTVRFGFDGRYLQAHTILSFTPSDNYGNLFFTSAVGSSYTGNQFADFLIGTPLLTQVDNVRQDNDGSASAYAAYVQDSWKATPNLTITAGLRYEFHPAFSDPNGNIANFDPSVPKGGRLLYEDGFASHLAGEELADLNACPTAGVTNPYATGGSVNGAPCTPVLSNTQAGVPEGLRQSPHLRFTPRLGFAYRPFSNDKTAIRGGAGYYNITTSGAIFYALTGTLESTPQTAYNSAPSKGAPAIVLPNLTGANTGQFGTAAFQPAYSSIGFNSAVKLNWQDPYSLQTDLSMDHDFGSGYAGRISYVGLHTWHLVWQPEQNMLPLSTTTVSTAQPRSAFPFPNFYQIGSRSTDAQADYRSLQMEFSHRAAKGLSLDAAYTLAKNLADNQGTFGAFSSQAAAFVDEQGGYNATWSGDRHLDYGNVAGTRRNRFIGNAVYQLPFGRGQRFGNHLNRATDLALGGFQLASILAVQSGSFLTASFPSGYIDPSGTGSGTLFFRQQRPDRIADANSGPHTRDQWFNTGAFACPGQTTAASIATCSVGVGSAPIGRFGTESTGDIRGPGLVSLSTGLSKAFALTEGLRLRAEGTFTNVLNHTNLADPVIDITSSDFGRITQSRGSDFAGSRTGQVSLRLEF